MGPENETGNGAPPGTQTVDAGRWATVVPVVDRTAIRCPLRVVLDRFPPSDAARRPASEVEEVRRVDRSQFSADILGELGAVPGAVWVEPGEGAEEATMVALADGAPLVLGPRFPDDAGGRRRGSPAAAVRAERRSDRAWAYHPLLIERHAATLVAGTRRPVALVAPLLAPWFAGAASDGGVRARTGGRDGLRLAHHHRVLEAAGHGSAVAAGAVIGTERSVVWQRLDRGNSGQASTLERHDTELAFRLDLLEAADRGEIGVPSVSIGECSACPWLDHCEPVQQASDSTSLVPGIGYRQWRSLREVGVNTRAELADLSHRDALVRDSAARWGGLASLVARAAKFADDVALGSLTGAEGGAALAALGVYRVADLLSLDPRVVGLSAAQVGSLAEAVHRARIHGVGGGPELRHGIDRLVVPRADVEIDLDMENALDGTPYLWGAWADDAYHSVQSWEQPSPAVAAAVFVDFWSWLDERRRRAHEAGMTIAFWCWYSQAEAGALRLGAQAAATHLGRLELVEEVESFVAGPDLVDLHQVFTSQLLTDSGAGLKVIAARAGFAWRDSEPSGEASMAWHATAVSGPAEADRSAARRRLLDYNEDDVRATAAVRRWMREDLPARLVVRSV